MIFNVSNLSAGYRGHSVLSGVSFSLKQGDVVGLIGPNGSGKSTLFRAMMGLIELSSGSIRFGEMKLENTTIDLRARLGLGYFAQTKNIFPSLTVRENLVMAASFACGLLLKQERLKVIEEFFPFLFKEGAKRAGLLSGGQRQLLALAMVLVRRPRVLLLDEPLAGVSPSIAQEILQAISSFSVCDNLAVIIIEHRLRQIHPHLNRVAIMSGGLIVQDTTEVDRILEPEWVGKYFK
jgi:branched-chain amino acid transport system ATP-binding protein